MSGVNEMQQSLKVDQSNFACKVFGKKHFLLQKQIEIAGWNKTLNSLYYVEHLKLTRQSPFFYSGKSLSGNFIFYLWLDTYGLEYTVLQCLSLSFDKRNC